MTWEMSIDLKLIIKAWSLPLVLLLKRKKKLQKIKQVFPGKGGDLQQCLLLIRCFCVYSPIALLFSQLGQIDTTHFVLVIFPFCKRHFKKEKKGVPVKSTSRSSSVGQWEKGCAWWIKSGIPARRERGVCEMRPWRTVCGNTKSEFGGHVAVLWTLTELFLRFTEGTDACCSQLYLSVNLWSFKALLKAFSVQSLLACCLKFIANF